MSAIPIIQKYTLEELQINNEMREHHTTSFPINPRISFQISRPAENQPFNGVLTIEIGNLDDASPLYVKVRIRAFLLAISKKGEESPFDPEEFHRRAFPAVFDIARTIIASTTQIGGMTPIILNPVDPSKLNVEKSKKE